MFAVFRGRCEGLVLVLTLLLKVFIYAITLIKHMKVKDIKRLTCNMCSVPRIRHCGQEGRGTVHPGKQDNACG